MNKVFITGGNGIIGQALAYKLKDKGFDVTIITRKKSENTDFKQILWDWKNYSIDKDILVDGCTIVHLAGADLSAKKWTNERKIEILDSRIKSASFILNKFIENNIRPNTFISSSAIGYYGSYTSNKIFRENDQNGDDFLAHTCDLWEHVADNYSSMGIRTVKIRTGVVLANNGGVLSKMKKTFKKGLGVKFGSGKQFMPWIHIDDIANIYLKAVEDENMKGVFNGVAPEFTNNKDFSYALAKVLHKKIWLPNVPAIVLNIVFGEMAVILLEGSRVSAEKILSTGFEFKYPKLEDALKNLVDG